jgi:hypothetical protein
VELHLHSPSTPSWRGAQLKKHRDKFSFTFILLAWTGASVEKLIITQQVKKFFAFYGT